MPVRCLPKETPPELPHTPVSCLPPLIKTIKKNVKTHVKQNVKKKFSHASDYLKRIVEIFLKEALEKKNV